MKTEERNLDYYMNLAYKIEITPEGGTGFNAEIPLLKGCMAWGETIEDACRTLVEIKRAWFEIALERGWQIPEPSAHRDIVKQVFLRHARSRPSHGDIRFDVVFDEEREHYALMQVGWEQGRRVRDNLVYVTLHNGTVHIEYDGIEHSITDELIAGGIPQDRIILAFLPER